MHRLLILCFGLINTTLLAQDGFKIDFEIRGLKDTTVYLGYFLQEKTFVKDTAKVNGTETLTFQGAQTLPQGIYFLVLGKTRIFDFVIGQDQHFSLATSTEDYIKQMVVKGDNDNKLFFENMRFNMEHYFI